MTGHSYRLGGGVILRSMDYSCMCSATDGMTDHLTRDDFLCKLAYWNLLYIIGE